MPPSSVIYFKAIAEAQSNDSSQEGGAQSLTLSRISVPTCDATLLCDTSTRIPCPLVPPQFRRQVFDALHSLSHPGVRATQRLVTSRYVWPGLNKDVQDWTHTCLQCQWAKVYQHTSSPIGQFPPPYARFAHVHIDHVRPLPFCEGFTYLLTCSDRFTHWPEVVALTDITATSVARAFLTGWIAHFGVPTPITTDCGSQFDSDLWQQLVPPRLHMDMYHGLPPRSQWTCRTVPPPAQGQPHVFFTIIGSTGKPQTISVDRLKPAHTDNPAVPTSSASASSSVPASSPAAAPQVVRTTRSGRHVHWPDRLVF